MVSLLALLALPVAAQDYYNVQVMVLNSADGDKPFDEVKIYIFETEAEGRQAVRLWEQAKTTNKETGVFYFDPRQASSMAGERDLRGTSWPATIRDVSSTGALLFTSELGGFPYKLEMVKGRREMTVKLQVQQVEMLEAATLKASKGPRARIVPPVERGDTLLLNKNYLFDQEKNKNCFGKTDARFAMQSYLIPPGEHANEVQYRAALVMDGEDYHETQLRRMGYKGERDPMFNIASQSPVLTPQTKSVWLRDKIVKDGKTKGGMVMANVWLEDYNMVYFRDTIEVEDLRRLARPMQFLDFALETFQLDPKDPLYVKEPRVVKMDRELDLSVNFQVGRATIDPKDTVSTRMLSELRNIVYSVTHTPGSEMRGYKIYGKASPEGSYAKNLALARERMQYIKREVDAEISPAARTHFVGTPTAEAEVAGWDELADSLAVDSMYVSEAAQIRQIVAQYPGNIDQQGAKMHQLPFYNTLIKDNLARLRKVTFFYSQSVFRAMTPEEMFEKLRTDPQFQHGGNLEAFMPYEFWVMMQHVKDTAELEIICRRAMEQDKKLQNRKEFRWPLPANMLAASYLEQGKVDTTILAPYIFEDEKINQPYNLGESRALLNPVPVVANQVAMMLRAERYTRALQLAMLFKDIDDPKLQQLYSIVRCKAGYYDSSTEEGRQYYEQVRATSPQNAVVMDMANSYLSEVPDYLAQMDSTKAVTDYLRAQYYCIDHFIEAEDNTFSSMDEDVQKLAIRALVACFQKDEKFIETAECDWYIFKGLYENALKEYREPGSVLPPEADPTAPDPLETMTEEEKMDIIRRGNNGELTTDEEWNLFDRLSGF